jgi:hypothetical protein
MRQKNFKALPLSLFTHTFNTSPIHYALFHSGSYAHHILLITDIMGHWSWDMALDSHSEFQAYPQLICVCVCVCVCVRARACVRVRACACRIFCSQFKIFTSAKDKTLGM